ITLLPIIKFSGDNKNTFVIIATLSPHFFAIDFKRTYLKIIPVIPFLFLNVTKKYFRTLKGNKVNIFENKLSNALFRLNLSLPRCLTAIFKCSTCTNQLLL